MTQVVHTYLDKTYYYPHQAALDLLNRLDKEYVDYVFITKPFVEPYKFKNDEIKYVAACKIKI